MTEVEWLESDDPGPMLTFLRGRASERGLRRFMADCCRQVRHLLPADLLRDAAGRQAIEVAESWSENLSDGGVYCDAFEAVLIAANCEIRVYEEPVLASTLRRPLPALLVLAVALRPRADGDHLWDAVRKEDVLGGEEGADLIQQSLGASTHAADALAADAVRNAERRRGLIARLFSPPAQSSRSAGERLRQDEFRRQAGIVRDLFANPFRPVSLDPAWRSPAVVSLAQAAYDERLLPAGTLDPGRLAVLADALEDAGCDNADLLSHLRGPRPHVRGCWPLDLILGKQ